MMKKSIQLKIKKILLLYILSLSSGQIFAQKQTFDLYSYVPPEGWTKEVTEASINYTYIDKKDKSWCQIGVFKSTVSKGNLEDDFASEWDALVVKQYKAKKPPQISVEHADGWDIKSGATNFKFKKDETAVILTTFSGFGVCLSIVAVTPYQRYFQDLEDLIASIELQTPVVGNTIVVNEQSDVPNTNTNTNINTNGKTKTNYAFTTTNFDDGWTSNVKEDWVEVTKGDLQVLLHYPNPNVKPANTDPDVMCAAAWNVLVSPRYSNIQNYQTSPGVMEYERPYFAQAELTDNASGKRVFVILFKKGTGWLEFITPNKNTFLKNFGLDITTINSYSDSAIWDPLKKMADYNKFAIAQSDFSGTWGGKFSSNTYYANIYTGVSAGMSTFTSSQSFEFSNNNYSWKLVGINSYGGRSEFGQGKGKGVFKVVNDWQINFSEMEGKPKTFDAYFTAVKGGRILWLNDANVPGMGIYTGFSK